MSSTGRDVFGKARVGGRIGQLDLQTPDGPPVRLRRGGRFATVLVRVPPDASEELRAWLAEVDGARASFAHWDGRVVVVVAGTVEDSRALEESTGLRLPLTIDPAGSAGEGPEDIVIVVAGRWGEVYHVARAGNVQELPSPRELEEWLQFLATQCPE